MIEDLVEDRAPPRFRLVIDSAVCDAHGICALICPDAIALDEWGYAAVSTRSFDDRTTLRRARRAVAACPQRALRLVTSSET
jgi:ferredoxin